MMLRLAPLLALCSVALAAETPVFPKSWTAHEVSDIDIAQGATAGPNGLVCCDPKSPACKVQTQSSSGTHYWDGHGNQTRFDDQVAGQIIVNNYNIGRQMLVAPNMTCLQYCPLQDDFDPSPFWPTPDQKERVLDLGKATVDGVACQHFQWTERIAIVIKMQETNMYVKLGTPYATPVYEHDIIEPLGQKLGTEDTHWSDFTPGQPDPALFKVIGVKECPESPNCQQSLMQQRRRRDRAFMSYLRYQG